MPEPERTAAAAATNCLVLVRNGQEAGTATVTWVDPDTAEIALNVDENGRGAKLKERVTLRSGVPVSWTVAGTSLMGGAVAEDFARDDAGTASWQSQADVGDTDRDGFYLPADSGPFALALLVRHALTRGGVLDILPSGRVRVEAVQPPADVLPGARLYRVTGIQLHDQYVALDADGEAVAVSDASLFLAPGLVEAAERISAALQHTTQTRYRSICRDAVLHQNGRLVIRNARMLDETSGTLTEPRQIVIEQDRIVGVGPEDPILLDHPGTTVVDAAGRVALPGLHDMHAHLSPSAALLYIAAGVTQVRDMGNDNDALAAMMDAIDNGRMIGPHVVPAGFIEGSSAYSARSGKLVASLEEALEAVNFYADRGFHAIKIYNSFAPGWVAQTAARAHQHGMRVLGHVPAFMNADRCIEDGYDEITHLNQLALGWVLEDDEDTRTPLRLTALRRVADLDLDADQVRSTIATMAERGIGLDVTLVILEQLMLSRARTVIPAHEPVIDHLPAGVQRYRKRTYLPHRDEADLLAYERAFDALKKIVAVLHEAGVPLWPGTDDGTGLTVHRELELFVEAGIPIPEVLRIAGKGCAQHLRQPDRGRIAPGMVADIVLVDGDPTESIRAIRNVSLTVAAGRAISPERIYRAMGMVPFAAEPAWQ